MVLTSYKQRNVMLIRMDFEVSDFVLIESEVSRNYQFDSYKNTLSTH